jgi:uncharacterized protein (TIGR04255 family)
MESRLLNMTDRALPEYDSPPAVETLMGFYFAPLSEWGVLRLGQVWSLFQADYPRGDVAGPVGDQIKFAMEGSDLSHLPLRAIFANRDRSELIQLQNSAFLRNWRKVPENEAYTHYADLKPRFQSDWRIFLQFLRERKIAAPSIFQCEVTYVNHLVRGKDWESFSDLAKWIKFFAPRGDGEFARQYSYLPEAANVGLSVGYTLPETGLTLQFMAQSAITMPDGAEVLQFTITAKAAPTGASDEALIETLDSCHDAVIIAFDDATTEFAHRQWRKS